MLAKRRAGAVVNFKLRKRMDGIDGSVFECGEDGEIYPQSEGPPNLEGCTVRVAVEAVRPRRRREVLVRDSPAKDILDLLGLPYRAIRNSYLAIFFNGPILLELSAIGYFRGQREPEMR